MKVWVESGRVLWFFVLSSMFLSRPYFVTLTSNERLFIHLYSFRMSCVPDISFQSDQSLSVCSCGWIILWSRTQKGLQSLPKTLFYRCKLSGVILRCSQFFRTWREVLVFLRFFLPEVFVQTLFWPKSKSKKNCHVI